MHIRSECFLIPRAPVTFTVSVTLTGTARPAGSNTQEERIKERLVVTLQRRGSTASQSLQISEQWVNPPEKMRVLIHSFNKVLVLVLGDKNSLILSVVNKEITGGKASWLDSITFMKLFRWPSFRMLLTPCGLATFWRISRKFSDGSVRETKGNTM